MGLVICPVSMVELSPAFDGNLHQQKEFLELCGVAYDQSFTAEDVFYSHKAWNHYVVKKRLKQVLKRPFADFMIGGFAKRFEDLITRNQADFDLWFPKLKIVVPEIIKVG